MTVSSEVTPENDTEVPPAPEVLAPEPFIEFETEICGNMLINICTCSCDYVATYDLHTVLGHRFLVPNRAGGWRNMSLQNGISVLRCSHEVVLRSKTR